MEAIPMMRVEQYVPKSSRLKIPYAFGVWRGKSVDYLSKIYQSDTFILSAQNIKGISELVPLLEDSSCDNQNNERIPHL